MMAVFIIDDICGHGQESWVGCRAAKTDTDSQTTDKAEELDITALVARIATQIGARVQSAKTPKVLTLASKPGEARVRVFPALTRLNRQRPLFFCRVWVRSRDPRQTSLLIIIGTRLGVGLLIRLCSKAPPCLDELKAGLLSIKSLSCKRCSNNEQFLTLIHSCSDDEAFLAARHNQ